MLQKVGGRVRGQLPIAVRPRNYGIEHLFPTPVCRVVEVIELPHSMWLA